MAFSLELFLGILGNIVSILVYLAPLPTFIRIYKLKSTMGFQSIPYIVALFSSTLWLYYGLMKHKTLLVSINSFGCVIETVYIIMYMYYASYETRTRTAIIAGSVNVILFTLIFVITFFVVEGDRRILLLGWICIFFALCVFVAPLGSTIEMIRTRNVEYMPISLLCFLTLTAVIWFFYGLSMNDLLIALPNVLGFVLGVIQIVIYAIFRRNSEPRARENLVLVV